MAADIFCSFELEPRTLSQGQLNQAREVAAGEAQNLVPTELASSLIFNEGVMPNGRKEMGESEKNGGEEVNDDENYWMEKKEEVEVDKKAYWLCTTSITTHQSSHHHTHHVNAKEPLSAPF
ncbi:hypothetical protein G2W53_028201 [Senna tora]|uniref:Uncharacterized protein n=1 Tax=Senna tora TaxID=362788 RepID=A0A834T5L2_9FABA|nr:hypothetical protein G2W53_028201 [Senna tora]